MTVLDPRGFSNVVEWADRMKPLLDQKSDNYPQLDNPNDWQRWGVAVFANSNSLGNFAPDPYDYTDWRDWAQRLFSTANFVG